jgi:hypothetical protein
MRARVAASGRRGDVLGAVCDGRERSDVDAELDVAAGAMGVGAGGVAFATTFFAQPANAIESAITAAQAKNRDFILTEYRPIEH